jgi:aspartyl-tRNA(Asn)/glutamyl-tRNA(Gln) amidotransferase subunit A
MASSHGQTPLSISPLAVPSLSQLAADLQAGRLTCAQLLERCLDQVDAWEPAVRAWVVLDRDRAGDQARRLDQLLRDGRPLGPLHGLPIGVKDIIDVAGFPTACGASQWATGPAPADAPLVARLRAAGALILGKTVTTPYAWIDPPVTRNPWNLDHTPGGSSSGSAAAVATGMALAALGTQTGGSITRPAAYCGVCGLKPTHGVLPLEGILPFAPTLDHPGPIARSIADLELLWSVLGPAAQPGPSPSNQPIRLGRPGGPFLDRATPDMRHALDTALETLAAAGVATVHDFPLPAAFEAVHAHHRTIMAAEAAALHAARLDLLPADYPPHIRALIEEGRALTPQALQAARHHHALLVRHFQDWPEEVDALVTPAAPGAAPDPSTTGDPVMNSPWSYTGLPTVSFPIARSDNGLPLGLQLIAGHRRERALLALARLCETTLWPEAQE